MSDTTRLRQILATELERGGNRAHAQKVLLSHDNDPICNAALRAMLRVQGTAVTRPLAREAAYTAIDSERAYQESDHGFHNRRAPDHELAAYITFMDDYLTEAKHQITRDWKNGQWWALDTLRKVVALGVAAMEHHGAVLRVGR